MKKLVFIFATIISISASAESSSGECAVKAIRYSYQAMMKDTFKATAEDTPITTFFFDMKTLSSLLVKDASIENGPTYLVVILDNSNNQKLEFTVEVTATGCFLKSAVQTLSGEE